MTWIPLHLYSQYSVLASTISIEKLVGRAASLGFSSLALTDRGNLYGAVEFFKACKGAKIRPILGCELYVAPHSRLEKTRIFGAPAGSPIVLLAKDQEGFQNLCRLSSLAHLEGFYYTPRIDKELLQKYHKGLVCLSGPHYSPIGRLLVEGRDQEAEEEILWYRELFGEDFYLELLRHPLALDEVREEGWLCQKHEVYVAEQQRVNESLLAFGKSLGIACVAAHASRYLDQEDWSAHETLLNVQSGQTLESAERDSFGKVKNRVPNPKREVMFTHRLHFPSKKEMQDLFADHPEALTNSCLIAEKCTFEFDFKTKCYPVFVPPALEGKEYSSQERVSAAAQFLRDLCEKGVQKRYTKEALAEVAKKYPGRDPLEVVQERLKFELDLILSKEMGDYLLIVWDFIAWAKAHGIPMGPGRGSGAGSIVLYLIEITDIEPLRFNLFFERFINPERISYPDIDVDICMDRRPEVIEYTVRKYGKERVAQIITFGTMKAKMAIKDVGRVLDIPLSRVNEVSKLIPEDPNMTLEKALELDPELREVSSSDPEMQRWIELARKLEGSIRNTGIHAAGMIIAADPIIEKIPICMAKDSEMAVTQFSMKPVESVGMLKIDFLGLKTLTAIQHAVNAVRKRFGIALDWVNLPLDDRPTFDLLNHGKTMGLFQLESGGMQDLAKQLHIDKFEEIIAAVALYRPGPMEMIPSFVNRKHGKEPIEFEHPWMEDILSETYGIMVYQEQVMQIASRLAGYSLGEGDVLRRAMGKKDRDEMARQREKFRNGALKNGIDPELSMRIFDKVEKFASYGFNKSHAAAYGYLSYVTAFLKANYPAEWMAALMTSDRDDLSKVTKVIRECQAMEIAMLAPDINESGKEFTATDRGIRFALGGIKGVGEGVVDAIVAEREKKGPFFSLYEFIRRIDARKIGKKAIESLIETGCFDQTGWSRFQLLTSVGPMCSAAAKEQKEAEQGVISLFSLLGEEENPQFFHPPEDGEKTSSRELLKREYELLGFYLNGHPLDEYRPLLQKLSCVPFKELEELPSGSVCRIAFIVEGLVVRVSAKHQKKFAILVIGDGLERFELPIWSDLYEQKGALLGETQLLYAVVQTEVQDGELRLQCRWLDDLTKVDEEMLASCDKAYEKAKEQARMHEQRDKKWESKKMSEAKGATAQRLMITIDSSAPLSHILELKKLFRSHSGNTPVEVVFTRDGAVRHSLHIDASWGVSLSAGLEEKLRALSSVRQVVQNR